MLFAFSQAAMENPTQGLAISGVQVSGRRPIPNDAVFSKLVDGSWHMPAEGDTIPVRGQTKTWKSIEAGKDGSFDDAKFGGGYLDLPVQSETEKTVLLHETGATLLYVNGSPRPGDPYGTGNLWLPILLKQGTNEILLSGGRGPVHLELKVPAKPVTLQDSDATLPDLLTSERGPMWGSVILRNAEKETLKGCAAEVTLPDGSRIRTPIGSVLPMSDRKVAFRIPAPKEPKKGPLKMEVAILQGSMKLDEAAYNIDVREPLERHKVTFVSDIDGSVQYYAADPAQNPSPSNALVLTLHGASVEASGQAAAYGLKPWVTIVAATNRRPYGFDWEDIGRADALEVLNDAKKRFPHDPARVDLTGHSMGGHGTWAVGTLYPNLFASIAPSAGWISFWSYAGGWNPPADDPATKILRTSMNLSDTLGRDTNTLNEDVYILHGSADDNVPVEQAREMKKALEALGHPNLQYHEQPGAGHWWGNQCVDWPPIFDMIQKARLNPESPALDFSTQDPAVSSTLDWVTVQQQIHPLETSRVIGRRDASTDLKTTNVARIQVRGCPAEAKVVLDGQSFADLDEGTHDFKCDAGKWLLAEDGLRGQKSPDRGGPFKQIFAHRVVLVFGTHGDPDENKWAEDAARNDSETLLYRGNGAVDVVADWEFRPSRYRGRNVLLFGNRTTNSAWADLLNASPVQITKNAATVKRKPAGTTGIGGLLIYPRPGEGDTLVGAVTGTDLSGMRYTDRFGLFTSGVAYPDWILVSTSGKIEADGFFDNRWEFDPALSAIVDEAHP